MQNRHGEGQHYSESEEALVIMSYNVHSVLSEARFEALLEEMKDVHWDILVLVETWREEANEKLVLQSGHCWYGSGGTRGKCGVGFLVHERHSKSSFTAVSNRIACLDIKLGGKRFRVLGAYVPDCGHPDDEVELVLQRLEVLLGEARRKRLNVIVAGDFNGQVGRQDELDDRDILGPYGFGERNDRGQWILQWSSTNDLVFSNTHFDDEDTDSLTYRSGAIFRQLDYILVDRRLFKQVCSSKICLDVDVGSDHRAIALTLNGFKCSRKPRKKQFSGDGWSVDVEAYKRDLDATLLVERLGENDDFGERHSLIKKAMLLSADCARKELTDTVDAESAIDLQIKALITERRGLKNDTALDSPQRHSRRLAICKETQKLVRRRTHDKKNGRINAILQAFRGLKEIAQIKAPGKRHTIASMTNARGITVEDEKSIADVFLQIFTRRYIEATCQIPELIQQCVLARDIWIQYVWMS